MSRRHSRRSVSKSCLNASDSNNRLPAREVFANVGGCSAISDWAVSEERNDVGEPGGLCGCSRSDDLVRSKRCRNGFQDCAELARIRAGDHGEFADRAQEKVECDQALPRGGRLALEQRLNRFESTSSRLRQVIAAGQTPRAGSVRWRPCRFPTASHCRERLSGARSGPRGDCR